MGNVANIKVEPVDVYWGGTNIGFLDGDIELTMEEQAVDITAHQRGTSVMDSIRTGKNVSLGLTLKETETSKLTDLLLVGGDTATAVAEVTDITCPAAAGLGGKYFFINTANDAIQYYVWFDNASVDPAPAGYTGIQVDISGDTTASDVAASLQAELDALAGFSASVSGAVVTVTNAATGGTTDASDVDSGVTISVTTQGSGALPGWGISKDFGSQYADAQLLVLHPVALPVSNVSRDITFWKAYLQTDSMTISGENPRTVSVTVKVFPDQDRQDEISYFVLGDNK